jgi:hypothetical protein
MPKEQEDLMDAVGNSFGIQDQQPAVPEGDSSGSDEGQQQQELPLEQQQGESDGHRLPQSEGEGETGSDVHRGKSRGDGEQLFPEKPKKGPKGELLGKDGQVVAATRREKQLAYNLNRAQYAANQASRQLRQMQTHFQQYKVLDDVMKQNNLSPQMAQEALQLRAMAEKDPIMAVRDIVARVLSTGVTMEQLFGNDAVPSINARVITNELDRRLGPLERQTQQQQRQAQIAETAQVQMEEFVASHPHAETHGVEISNLVAQHGLTPERAYFELRSWVERRGFDFTTPLRPQIEAAMKRQRGGNGRGRSTPGSMRGVSDVPTQSTTNSRADFRSNAPWRDIAAAVFTELNNK